VIGGPSKFWVLPPEIMEPLQRTYNFDYDPCPFSGGFVEFDGLADIPDGKKSARVNPLFGRGITKWVRWAIKQANKGKTVVVILPMDNWVRLFMEQMEPPNAHTWGTHFHATNGEIRSLGTHDWLNPETGERRKSSRPSFLFVLRPKPLQAIQPPSEAQTERQVQP
jgi:hypothetical protein